MEAATYPKLHLPEWFDERSEFETPFRGYLSHAEVELEDGTRYKLFFIDPIRLQQDLEEEVKLGRPYIAEAGLIVLPEVTLEKIREVIRLLPKDDFFQGLKPLSSATR